MKTPDLHSTKPIELDELISFIQKTISDETRLEIAEIDIDVSMEALGLDSINSIFLLERLENRFDVELNPLMFWDYPTIRSFGEHLLYLLRKKDSNIN